MNTQVEFTEQEMDAYFKWLFNESNNPYDEVCDLLRKLPPQDKAEVRKLLNQNKEQ